MLHGLFAAFRRVCRTEACWSVVDDESTAGGGSSTTWSSAVTPLHGRTRAHQPPGKATGGSIATGRTLQRRSGPELVEASAATSMAAAKLQKTTTTVTGEDCANYQECREDGLIAVPHLGASPSQPTSSSFLH